VLVRGCVRGVLKRDRLRVVIVSAHMKRSKSG